MAVKIKTTLHHLLFKLRKQSEISFFAISSGSKLNCACCYITVRVPSGPRVSSGCKVLRKRLPVPMAPPPLCSLSSAFSTFSIFSGDSADSFRHTCYVTTLTNETVTRAMTMTALTNMALCGQGL